MKVMTDLLKELDQLHGVSGDEEMVAEYMKQELHDYVDEHYEDTLGNQIFISKGSNPEYSIMLTVHLDEIGYIVKYIDESGFISFLPVGIHDPRMAVNQVVHIKTQNDLLPGVVGSKPSHLVSAEESMKTIPFESLFIDVGTSSRKETEALGVAVGDYITVARDGRFLNNGSIYTGKAIDNRSGCAILIQLMKDLKGQDIEPTIYGVATVQEEIGIRGAGPAAFGLQPDIALAIDVTFAGGTPESEKKELPIEMGKGPAIKYFDWSLKTFNGNAVPKKLVRQMEEVGNRHDIPYQKEVNIGGATDAAKISLSGKGVLTGGLSIPMRYMHSSIGTVNVKDLSYTLSFIEAFVKTDHTDLLR